MKEITIYTDGACSGNPGPGGWGAVLIFQGNQKEISGGAKDTTNNIMEMTAVIEALKLLKEPCIVNLHSDSAYVVNAFNEHWIEGWLAKGWVNSKKEPVKNKELWLELIELTNKHKVKFIKVKGHSTNELNNRCDYLATTAAKQFC
jgi:ribonuclease HI